jgi:hypothetical protein
MPTIGTRIKRIALTASAGAALMVVALPALPATTAHAGNVANSFPCHHMDSTQVAPGKTGRNPSAFGPGTASGNNAYYYLTITAGCGKAAGTPTALTMTAQLVTVLKGVRDADGMCWRVDFDLGYTKPPLQSAVLMGDKITSTFTAKAGTQYRVRIASMESGIVISDHSTLDG